MSLLIGKSARIKGMLLGLVVVAFISVLSLQLQKIDELEHSVSQQKGRLVTIKNLEKKIYQLPKLAESSKDVRLTKQQLSKIVRRNGIHNFSLTQLANDQFGLQVGEIRGDRELAFIQQLPRYGVKLVTADISTSGLAEGFVAVEFAVTKINNKD